MVYGGGSVNVTVERGEITVELLAVVVLPSSVAVIVVKEVPVTTTTTVEGAGAEWLVEGTGAVLLVDKTSVLDVWCDDGAASTVTLTVTKTVVSRTGHTEAVVVVGQMGT